MHFPFFIFVAIVTIALLYVSYATFRKKVQADTAAVNTDLQPAETVAAKVESDVKADVTAVAKKL